jgi:hypothetical protein
MKKIAAIALTALMASVVAAPSAFAKGDGWEQLKKQEAKYAELRAKKYGTEAPKRKAYEPRRIALLP